MNYLHRSVTLLAAVFLIGQLNMKWLKSIYSGNLFGLAEEHEMKRHQRRPSNHKVNSIGLNLVQVSDLA